MLSFSLYGQNIEGNWNGNLMIENEEMALVFNFKKENEKYIGTMDIPSQGAIGMPISKVTFTDKRLYLEIMNGAVTYEGVLEDKVIIGKFKQGNNEFTLNLNKGNMTKPGNINLPSSKKELEEPRCKRNRKL